MREINTKEIEKAVYDIALKACTDLTPSCVKALKSAYKTESNELSKFALDVVIKNRNLASKTLTPVCQDTGLAVVILEIGQDVHLTGKFVDDAVNSAVKRAYKDGSFRLSCCDALTRKNTKTNTPAIIYTEIVKGDQIKVSFLPKGFGSENMSKIYMLTPAQGVSGIIDAIVGTVKDAGSKPCPPVYVGVGIGGTFDRCAYLAKKALLRPVGKFSNRKDVKDIEKEALKRINELKIGAQGFGGDVTALGVSVLTEPTHIAGLPVAVNIQCHVVRAESVTL